LECKSLLSRESVADHTDTGEGLLLLVVISEAGIYAVLTVVLAEVVQAAVVAAATVLAVGVMAAVVLPAVVQWRIRAVVVAVNYSSNGEGYQWEYRIDPSEWYHSIRRQTNQCRRKSFPDTC